MLRIRRDRLIDNGQGTIGNGVGWRLGEAPDWPDAQEVVNVERAETKIKVYTRQNTMSEIKAACAVKNGVSESAVRSTP